MIIQVKLVFDKSNIKYKLRKNNDTIYFSFDFKVELIFFEMCTRYKLT